MLRKSIMFFVVVGFFVITTNVHAALNAYLYIAEAPGSCAIRGHENSSIVHAFEQMTKMEMGTGGAGRPNVSPIVITKEVDKSSPVLRQMMITGYTIKQVTIKFYTPSVSGTEIQFYTLTMPVSRIVSMKTILANNTIPGNMQMPILEEITITSESAEWKWMEGAITTIEKR